MIWISDMKLKTQKFLLFSFSNECQTVTGLVSILQKGIDILTLEMKGNQEETKALK